ncbi:MAG TPA: hypothetical protein VI583_03940 [Cyclobacteriaceae bacterium]|nr:hypothetical protein [Cyclobacteriaceae bacterium]
MSYLNRVLKWIWEGKYLYILIILLLLVLLADNICIDGLGTADNIRIYGLLLQLTGAMIIVYSLKEKLILFKGHGLGTFLLNYFKTFPKTEKKRILETKGNIKGSSIVSGNARVLKRPIEDLKDIIRYFDEEIQFLHKQLMKTKAELKNDITTVKTNLDEVRKRLGKQIEDTQQLISDSTISNVWVDLFGISIIFIGLIYGTIPDLVEKIIW